MKIISYGKASMNWVLKIKQYGKATICNISGVTGQLIEARSGTASKVLGISRVDFLEKLGGYQVSLFSFHDESELDEDIKYT